MGGLVKQIVGSGPNDKFPRFVASCPFLSPNSRRMAVDVICCDGSVCQRSHCDALSICPLVTTHHPYLPSRKITRRFVSFAILKRSPKRLKYSAPRFAKEDGLLYVEVDPSGSDSWKLDPMIELLKEGVVGVIPTDTVYALVCDLRNNSVVE